MEKSPKFALLCFGSNAEKTYGKEEDKPAWWPKKTKWKTFKSPSKASKEENTRIIRCLLEYHGIDPNIHYINYPEEEGEETSDSSESEDDGWEGEDHLDEEDI